MSQVCTTVFGFTPAAAIPAWDAGAVSMQQAQGSGFFSFRVANATVGAVVGIGLSQIQPHQHFSTIIYGAQFNRGKYRVVDAGIPQTTYVAYAAGAYFHVVRWQGQVYLCVGSTPNDAVPYPAIAPIPFPGQIVHTRSPPKRPSTFTGAVRLAVSLYALNDSVCCSFTDWSGWDSAAGNPSLAAGGYGDFGVPGYAYGDSAIATSLIGVAAGTITLEGSGGSYMCGSASGSMRFGGVAFAGSSYAFSTGAFTLQGTIFAGDPDTDLTWVYGSGIFGLGGEAAGSEFFPSGADGELHIVGASTGRASTADAVTGVGYDEFTVTGYGLGSVTPSNYVWFEAEFFGQVSNIALWASEDDVADALEASSLDAPVIGIPLANRVQIAGDAQTFWTQVVSIADAVNVYVPQHVALIGELASALQATDADKLAYTLRQLDIVAARAAQQGQLSTDKSDQLQAQDVFAPAIIERVLELAAFGEDVSAVRILALHDTLAAHTQHAATLTSVFTLTLLAREFSAYADTAYAIDELVANHEFRVYARWLETLSEAIHASSDTAQLLTIAVSDVAQGHASDTVAALGQYFAQPWDTLGAWVNFRLGDEAFTGWVMNTENSMPLSEYQGYDFSSFCRVGNVYLGARDEGLYLLEGDTDDGQPIEAAVRTMMLDFGSPVMKRVQSAYIGYTSTGKLLLKVRAVTGGELTEQWYEATELPAQAPREQMVRVGRGLRSRYWQFELVNVGGADFEVTDLELHPVYLNRRV